VQLTTFIRDLEEEKALLEEDNKKLQAARKWLEEDNKRLQAQRLALGNHKK